MNATELSQLAELLQKPISYIRESEPLINATPEVRRLYVDILQCEAAEAQKEMADAVVDMYRELSGLTAMLNEGNKHGWPATKGRAAIPRRPGRLERMELLLKRIALEQAKQDPNQKTPEALALIKDIDKRLCGLPADPVDKAA